MGALTFYVLATRFGALGIKPMHHDESRFAYRACWIWLAGDYDYNAAMHGPLLETLTAILFAFLGDSETTARLTQAISGTLLILLVWKMRGRLGNFSAFAAAILLTASPTILYFSRYRNDVPFTLAAFVFIIVGLQFLERRRLRYWFLTILSFTWMVCIKEAYLTILLVLLTFWGIHRAARRMGQPAKNGNERESGPNRSSGTIAHLRQEIEVSRFAAVTFLGLGFSLLIIITLFTSFFRYPEHAAGPIEALFYWSAEHMEHRIYGEFHYYIPLLIIYEFLPLAIFLWGFARELGQTRWIRGRTGKIWIALSLVVFILAGAQPIPPAVGHYIHMTRGWHACLAVQLIVLGATASGRFITTGRALQGFFFWWTLVAFLSFSFAGEKVPWLSVHTVFPLIVAAAIFIQDIIGRTRSDDTEHITIRELVGPVAAFAQSGKRRALVAALIGAGLASTLFVVWRLTFANHSNPAERHVFVHTTKEYVKMVREVEAIAEAATGGHTAAFPVAVQGESEWPAYWYFRHCALSKVEAPTSDTAIFICDEYIESEGRRTPALRRWPWLLETHVVRNVPFRAWWRQKDMAATVGRLVNIWMVLLPGRYRHEAVTDSNGRPLRFGGDRGRLPKMTVEEEIQASLYAWRAVLRYLVLRRDFDAYRSRFRARGHLSVLFCVRKDLVIQRTKLRL